MRGLMKNKWIRRVLRPLFSLAVLVLCARIVPYWWCSRGAQAWYEGDPSRQQALQRTVEGWLDTELGSQDFQTGSPLFSGEWFFGTYLMAGLGFGQVALQHPDQRDRCVEQMQACVERILSDDVKLFDREIWRNDPIESLADDSSHHTAYLGYLNLLLGLLRECSPDNPYARLHDDVTAALVRRLEGSPVLLLMTYPYEMYPVDNCAVIASIGQYDRATGADHGDLIRRWVATCREKYVDPQTGILYQAVDPTSGEPVDLPRGSGTCLGLYFLSFVDEGLSRELYDATKRHLAGTVFGFGGVREYLPGVRGEIGDIDSGPVVMGYSFSGTGFALGGARIHGDPDFFARLYATASFFGAPRERGGSFKFVTGGPLGNAIMFAMLTARPCRSAEGGGPGP